MSAKTIGPGPPPASQHSGGVGAGSAPAAAAGATAGGGGGGGGGAYRIHHKGRPTKEVAKDEGESGPDNLKAGTRVLVKYKDGGERKAIVIERRLINKEADGTTKGGEGAGGAGGAGGSGSGAAVVPHRERSAYRYYVHWVDFNRRMDSWVVADAVRYDANEDAVAKADEMRRKREAAAKAAGGEGAAGSAGGVAGGSSHSGSGAHGGGHGGAAHGHRGPAAADAEGVFEEDEAGTVYRGHKRKADGNLVIDFVEPEHPPDMGEEALKEHEEITKVKNVNAIEIGRHRIDTWYFSPLPPEYWAEGDYLDTLYICEFCLKFFRHKSELLHHSTKCRLRHPPGDEIYRGPDGIGMWELDGSKEKAYCQNLSFIAKMFLDHKTLWHDVDLFLYYVMTERDAHGHHVVGYYSKEKHSELGYNLACILTLPSHQRRGFGRFLIEFSYELSKIEKKAGHPEKPLSDLGLISYRSYWSSVLLTLLLEDTRIVKNAEVSVLRLVQETSIRSEDIISTLQHLGLIKYVNGTHVIVVEREWAERKLAALNKPGPRVTRSKIHWAPLRLLPLTADGKKKRDRWLLSSIVEDSKPTTGGGGAGE